MIKIAKLMILVTVVVMQWRHEFEDGNNSDDNTNGGNDSDDHSNDH